MRAWRIPFFECLFCVLLGATTMANDEAISSCPLGPEAEESIENTVLIPCGICGRTFKSESLLKHQSVCQKNATKKRRVFDSMKQRIRGTELAEYIPIPVVPPKPKLIPVSKPAVKKVSKDELRTGESPNVGQHSNTPAAAEKTPVRSAVTRSNSMPRGGGAFREERCPHCDRTFGWKAFSRHEEWCREHKSRLAQAQSPAAVLKAKEMLEARIKYRAPSLGKSKRPTNREKYSGGVHMSPAVHKLSVDNSPVLSSMKPTVSSSNKVVSESRLKAVSKSSTPQASAAMPPHQANTPSAPTPRRALSPSKKISRVIQNPWQSSGGVDKSSGSDEVISQPVGGGNRLSGKDESLPRLPPPSRQSTYDPFSRAEMQLQELLSDGTARSHSSLAAPSCKEAVQNGSLEKLENISAKTNGNNEADRHCIEKQAKEIELPDIFTETSTQLDFEMPSVTRSRDRSVNTKRRALKPTPQNMGIELIRRDNYAGLSASPMEKSTGNMFEDEEVEQITSIMDLGFCIPHLSQGGVQARDEIESIHQSINLVALGLSNLSAASPRSMADKDNNNGQEQEGKRGGGSLGDSDSEGGGERVPKAPLAGRAPAQQASSHESLTGTQPLIVGKPSVDSAYSSLNRPAFRTIEQAKEAAVVSAFDLPHHGSSSSEGENEHEWSDGEGGGTLRGSRLNAEANSNSVKYAKFCHNCGSKYPLSEAKFCCVCGAQRLAV